MKNLKNALKILPLLLFLVLVSCKKKNAAPDAVAEEIAAKELLDYYIVAEHAIGPNKLMILYFTEDNMAIKAQAHLLDGNKIINVDVKKSAFSIDYFGDGKAVYNFVVERDATGKLILKSYSFNFNGQGNELAYATMVKTRAAPIFTGLSYKMIPSNVPFNMINTGTPFSIKPRSSSDRGALLWGSSGPYFSELINIGFKTVDGAYMAVSLPNWKSIDKPIMLLERKNELFIAAKNQ